MRYLTTDPTPAPYTIEEGVIVDDTERPTRRQAYDAYTRYWRRSKEDLRAEEAAWVARSGPCVILRAGKGEAR